MNTIGRICMWCMLFSGSIVITASHTFAQNMHPEVQALVDDLNVWMEQQVKLTGTVDPSVLEQKSARIRMVQDSLNAIKVPETYEIPTGAKSTKKITKTLMAGSSATVPEKTEWRVTGMYVKNDSDSYRILVKSVDLKEVYSTGDKLVAPTISSEAALLTGDSMSASYDFDIVETVFE